MHLPPRLCFGKAVSIDTQLARAKTAMDFSMEASVIWQQLTTVRALPLLHMHEAHPRAACASVS